VLMSRFGGRAEWLPERGRGSWFGRSRETDSGWGRSISVTGGSSSPVLGVVERGEKGAMGGVEDI